MGDFFMNDLKEQVLEIVSKHTGRPPSVLSLETDLFGDLGMDGDDALDLLLHIRSEFGVDMDAVQFDKHFGPETAFNPFAVMLPSWWRIRSHRLPVTCGTLVEAARTQVWPLEYAEEAHQ